MPSSTDGATTQTVRTITRCLSKAGKGSHRGTTREVLQCTTQVGSRTRRSGFPVVRWVFILCFRFFLHRVVFTWTLTSTEYPPFLIKVDLTVTSDVISSTLNFVPTQSCPSLPVRSSSVHEVVASSLPLSFTDLATPRLVRKVRQVSNSLLVYYSLFQHFLSTQPPGSSDIFVLFLKSNIRHYFCPLKGEEEKN